MSSIMYPDDEGAGALIISGPTTRRGRRIPPLGEQRRAEAHTKALKRAELISRQPWAQALNALIFALEARVALEELEAVARSPSTVPVPGKGSDVVTAFKPAGLNELDCKILAFFSAPSVGMRARTVYLKLCREQAVSYMRVISVLRMLSTQYGLLTPQGRRTGWFAVAVGWTRFSHAPAKQAATKRK